MKKLFACLLALCLLLSMLPTAALAEEEHPVITTAHPREMQIGTLEDQPSSEELLEDYLDHVGLAAEPNATNYVEGNLNKVNRYVYRAAKKMAEDIVAGKQTYTRVTVTAEEMGITNTGWTAAELGVSTLAYGGYITDEAWDAALERVGFVPRTVCDAVAFDCSYELFWRSLRYTWSDLDVEARWDPAVGDYRLYPTGQLKFGYYVEPDWSAGENFYVDQNKIQAAVRTASKADAIVKRYANETDLDKLKGYANEICALNTYNTDALSLPSSTYGNPWQLIHVFDGDPSTNVVCEGYAKAFKYLVDHTRFDGNIQAWCISGDVYQPGGGGGAHMWNVVRMDDGRNYHMDVTFADDGNTYDPQFFLRSAYEIDPNEYYGIEAYGRVYYYVYDQDSLNCYSTSQRTISTLDYVPGPAPSKGTLVREADGRVGYYVDGKLDKTYFGFVYYGGSSFLVANGYVVTSKSGLAQDPNNRSDWYFLSHGQVQNQKSGLVQYDGEWFYVEYGRLDTTFSGVVAYDGGLFLVARGRLVSTKNGIGQDPITRTWYYFSHGQVQNKYTGLAQYDGSWFYIQAGVLDKTFTGIVTYNGSRFYVKNGTMVHQV